MSVSFDEARRIVRRSERPKWPPDMGHFMVARYGYQDATHWLVITGAREALVDGDPEYAEMDAPALLVDKRTGELTHAVYLDVMDRLEAMQPVGRAPSELSALDVE